MIDIPSLFKTTGEFKALCSDKKKGVLSHAYLTVTPDGRFLDEYLKYIAKIFVCEEDEPCLRCRKCRLIDRNAYADVRFFPKDDAVKTEDVTAIIEESFIKPVEDDKKVFIISHAETMSDIAQNKLLKTLEEPPANVYMILGATGEFPLLSTLKSRVKKFEIPAFSDRALFSALKDDCPDAEKLRIAIAAGDGTAGGALNLYNDEEFAEITEVATDVIVNMKKSTEILAFSNKVAATRCDLKEFLSVLLIAFREMLCKSEGRADLIRSEKLFDGIKGAEGFTRGAIMHAIDKTNEALTRKKYNGNDQMITEWLFFQILEGKYKWQK
ncbi:MAG: hypothetical protein J5697_01385 [Clostridia bacterium]|nr:hypothetical protein [Clostridia bacterium]